MIEFPTTLGNRVDDSDIVARVLDEHGPQMMGVIARRLGWPRDRANEALGRLRRRGVARYSIVEMTAASGNPYTELLWRLNDD